jgi:hypothetical protein
MEAVRSSEISVNFYRNIWVHIPEYSNLHSHRYENFKSKKIMALEFDKRDIFQFLSDYRILKKWATCSQLKESTANIVQLWFFCFHTDTHILSEDVSLSIYVVQKSNLTSVSGQLQRVRGKADGVST